MCRNRYGPAPGVVRSYSCSCAMHTCRIAVKLKMRLKYAPLDGSKSKSKSRIVRTVILLLLSLLLLGVGFGVGFLTGARVFHEKESVAHNSDQRVTPDWGETVDVSGKAVSVLQWLDSELKPDNIKENLRYSLLQQVEYFCALAASY